MVHMLIIDIAATMLHHTKISGSLLLGVTVVIVFAVVAVSVVLNIVVEKPVDRIRQRKAAGSQSRPLSIEPSPTVELGPTSS